MVPFYYSTNTVLIKSCPKLPKILNVEEINSRAETECRSVRREVHRKRVETRESGLKSGSNEGLLSFR